MWLRKLLCKLLGCRPVCVYRERYISGDSHPNQQYDEELTKWWCPRCNIAREKIWNGRY